VPGRIIFFPVIPRPPRFFSLQGFNVEAEVESAGGALGKIPPPNSLGPLAPPLAGPRPSTPSRGIGAAAGFLLHTHGHRTHCWHHRAPRSAAAAELLSPTHGGWTPPHPPPTPRFKLCHRFHSLRALPLVSSSLRTAAKLILPTCSLAPPHAPLAMCFRLFLFLTTQARPQCLSPSSCETPQSDPPLTHLPQMVRFDSFRFLVS